VAIEFQGQDWSNPRVIGFKNNLKGCGFVFKLTREDGTIADDTMGVNISVYDSSGSFRPTMKVFNPGEKTWTVSFYAGEEIDPNGYRVQYYCDHSITTQDPYK